VFILVLRAMTVRKAGSFYAGHGFIRLPESMRLVLPMQTIAKLFAAAPGASRSRR
jgi:hypothetical protein